MSPKFKAKAMEVTNEWKTKTVNELAARHITRAMLAKQLGVTISQLFKTTKSSDLVPKIDALLQLDSAARGYVSAYDKLTDADRNLADAFLRVLIIDTPPSRTEEIATRRGEIIDHVRSLLPKMTPDGRAYLHETLTEKANEARTRIDSATTEMLDAQRALFKAQRQEQAGRALLERMSIVLAMFTQVPIWEYSAEEDDVVIDRSGSPIVKVSLKKGDKKKSA